MKLSSGAGASSANGVESGETTRRAPANPSTTRASAPDGPAPGATAQDNVEARAQMASQVQHLSHLTRALSGEKQFLRAALDSTEDALVAFDVSGHFVLCNRVFEQLFGLSAGELAGRDEAWLRARLADRLSAPDDFFQMTQPPAETAQQPCQVMVEWSAEPGAATPAATRTPRILRWYSGPVRDAEGRLVGHIATQRDITRETEVDVMKTEFISIVSHELRTPMTSIKGYVDLILDGDTGEINHLQRDFLSTVQRNTRRLVAMINDMLDISRIESGNIEFDVRPLSLPDVIEQALELVKPQADEKNLSIEVEWPPSSRPGRVLGDFDRVLQALINLLSNAVKYTPAPPQSPGRITVAVRVEKSAAHAVSAFARIAVRDTGIGISAHDQALLFQKFFRADNNVTREIGGTGLGLSITQALVEKMGGEMSVSSRLGEGSEFAFTLPLATAPKRHRSRRTPSDEGAAAGTEADGAEADGAGADGAPRVLVVDDDPDVVDLISLYLQRNGYQTTVAYSGPEALRLLDEERFDAMTLDLLMPRMDGFAVLRHLQDNPALRSLPVVIVSVTSTPPSGGDAVQDALRLGAYDFIAKPLDENRLRATLSRALASRALASRATSALETAGAAGATGPAGAPKGAANGGAPGAGGPADEDFTTEQPRSSPHAVIVDGNGELAGEIAELLEAQGARVTTVATPAAALAEGTESPVDLIVLNPLSWGDQTLQLVEALREVEGGAPFLLFTEPNAGGQYVLSRFSAHMPLDASIGAAADAPADAALVDAAPGDATDMPRALRDICARLDEILHRRSASVSADPATSADGRPPGIGH